MKRTKKASWFAANNTGYPASLEISKLCQAIPDETAAVGTLLECGEGGVDNGNVGAQVLRRLRGQGRFRRLWRPGGARLARL
jgi:hypothetical protein